MDKNTVYKKFSSINLYDSFFDSLRTDYPKFNEWFHDKKDEYAYVKYNDSKEIEGFLYLKIEADTVDDVRPTINSKKILKVGTFKINPHGTRLGERFIKIITDVAIKKNSDICYITVFPKHKYLINLINRFGFVEYGDKGDNENPEKVFVKDFNSIKGDTLFDYPLISTNGVNKYIMSIYPKYHSPMFPDSILNTENRDMLNDISYTNSIHKIYICSMNLKNLKPNDIIILYRTADENKMAKYSSVVTTIGVVEEIKTQNEFNSFDSFYKYACQYSIFDMNDLKKWYDRGKCKAIKFTYNSSLPKRITRNDLIQKVGLNSEEYWGFFQISDSEFEKIINLSNINKKLFI